MLIKVVKLQHTSSTTTRSAQRGGLVGMVLKMEAKAAMFTETPPIIAGYYKGFPNICFN